MLTHLWHCNRERSIVGTLLNQTKCRADDFIGKTAVTVYGVKGAFKAADHALPGTAIVRCGREIELPKDALIGELTRERLLILLFNAHKQLVFSANEVCPIV